MKARRYIFAVVSVGLLFLLSLGLIQGETPTAPPVITSVDSLLQKEIAQENISGAVVQIKQSGAILHRKAYGYAHLYDYGMVKLDQPEPMITGHLFDLASLTKVFATTFGVMLLVDDGKVLLDKPVKTYLPKFSGPHKDSVTVRHLLTHSSGLYRWQPLYYHGRNSKETLQYICDLPLKYPVGEARHYSDLGFMLLGYLIENQSGQSLDGFLKKRLYNPLGLKHTTFMPERSGQEQFAATSHGNPFEHHMVADDNFGYYCSEDVEDFTGWRHYTLIGEVNDGNSYYANKGMAGHAGLFSTVDDLQALINLLLNKGRFNGEQLIREEIIDLFLTKDEFGNGLGWGMSPEVIKFRNPPEGSFGHTGFTGTNVLVIPEYNFSLILLTNRQNVGLNSDGYYYNLNPLRRQIAKIAFSYVKE
ncbi:MAG: Esterase EstB [Candidatus Marinimicrobia bacterium]|nr:Esterase EstB [Candidatus Neomarinimicrobiota bacterium]